MIASNPDSVRCPYAVGDVITTSSPTPPAERWPGTVWQQIKDRFLLGAGDKYPAGSTGGEEKIHLLKNNLPWGVAYDASRSATPDNPIFGAPLSNLTSGYGVEVLSRDQIDSEFLPPYKAYYMWERTG